MNYFLKKVTQLVVPFLILLSFPVYVEYVSGEFMPLEEIIRKQIDDPAVVYGTAYSDQSYFYRSAMAQQLQPEVLALGNSKILTMRQGFFNQGVRFYNAGAVTPSIESFKVFLEKTQVTPKVIIMTLEPLHFDPALRSAREEVAQRYHKDEYYIKFFSIISQSWLGVYYDFYAGKFSLEDLKSSSSRVGLNARITGTGILGDGSFHYGKQYHDTKKKEDKIANAIRFIETKQSTPQKEFIGSEALAELDAFLKYCKSKNMYVIAYIPPTPQSIEKAYSKKEQYAYLFKVAEYVDPIFKKYDFTLYNFFSMASVGSTDKDAIDEYHTNEKVMVKTLLAIVSDNKTLQSYTSRKKLENILLHAEDGNDVLR
jgi:hypothetical protein